MIPEEYIPQIDCSKIAGFFTSELGMKIRSSNRVLREFKFSILVDGNCYGEGLEGEKILLQGVVDFALIEEDGITIIDYKTDYVSKDNLQNLIAKYKAQIEAYADALSRIYELPIKSKQIYFFSSGAFVPL